MRKYRDEDIIERMVKDNYLAFSRLERSRKERYCWKQRQLSQNSFSGQFKRLVA